MSNESYVRHYCDVLSVADPEGGGGVRVSRPSRFFSKLNRIDIKISQNIDI